MCEVRYVNTWNSSAGFPFFCFEFFFSYEIADGMKKNMTNPIVFVVVLFESRLISFLGFFKYFFFSCLLLKSVIGLVFK